MSRKIIDLTGQKFNHLTVLEKDTSKTDRTYWICQCDCGNIISVRGDSLKNGCPKSCGCLQRENLIDLTGQKFGRLLVLKRDTSKSDYVYWLCQCDCGNITSVISSHLRKGNTTSCGCLQKEKASKMFTIDLTGQRFGYLKVLKRDFSKKGGTYWICQCDCGNITSILSTSLKKGSTTSCGCINSKGENKIRNILTILKIDFTQQKTFNDLKYKYKLRFDFFLPDYNCCIEYNGIQHYKAIEYFGGEKSLKEQKEKDNLKRQWCKENNIKLIEIPYTDYDKINEDYLKSRL